MLTKENTYCVRHKHTGRYFAGFDGAGAAIWADNADEAAPMTPREAALQALIFVRFGHPVATQPLTLTTCMRCDSLLNADGKCTDLTCPFSDYGQDDPRGWTGHPDHE